LVAILNAACWSVITPPFQVPDEPSHFAYVKQLAETHTRPSSHALELPGEEVRVLTDLQEFPSVILAPTGTISTRAQQRKLERDLAAAAELPREGSTAAGVATSQPPLYYLLEAIPYASGSGGSLLTRLELMRLLSALFAGLTALFVFLFVRETLPGTRTAWVAGGLSIAFAPLLGFVSGSVNPDSLLFAISAALLWSLARAFRRGLTYRLAIAIGVITAAGLLTKLNFVGLFPGVMVGLGVLALRVAPSSRSRAYRAFGLGAGIAASPIVAVAIINLTTNRPTFGLISSAAATATHRGSNFAAISYIWQAFLPRLPGMKSYDHGVFTTQQIWFNGFVGRYGWGETSFPEWAYKVAAIFGVAALVACARTLVVLRKTVRERLAELVVYSVMGVGLLILIGGASYISLETESFTETRYLLPLLALFAAGLGLAIRAAGRRWEAVLGTIVVLAMLADDIFSQLLVIARYYG
jgi:4-amino-4-deoxy-L-arabinose transferase-like glycosyltransferase